MNIKVNFVGRLGSDAEIVTLPERTPFISFRAVVNERIGKEDVATWLTVTGDYEKYKNMLKYLTKGSVVCVGGTERCSLYTSKSGVNGIDRKIIADFIEFAGLGKKDNDSNNNVKRESVTVVNAAEKQDLASALSTGTIKKNQPVAKVEVTGGQDDDLPF